MKRYVTEYSLNGTHFLSEIFAPSQSKAEECVKLRHIEETILGKSDNNKLKYISFNDKDSVIHALVFAIWISTRSRTTHPDDTLSDKGVLHEYLHYKMHPTISSMSKGEIIAKSNKVFRDVFLGTRIISK